MIEFNAVGYLNGDLQKNVSTEKVIVKGKFLYLGEDKFYIKGVTYGTFKPEPNGNQFPDPEVVEKDFSLMASNGLNAVRTYTVPPKYLLDLALKYNLKVMVGLPWEQHIIFLGKKRRKQIIEKVAEGVRQCQGHRAILCFAIGNEIPSSIVRWYGKNKIESFLKKLNEAVKAVDPDALVTYVNYPTTEYLDLSFLDFDCFNVYLETPEKLTAYLARLHNLSGDRPLVLAEIGLDSLRNGVRKQAETLSWQIDKIFASGSAGMFVFAWTDEWWRGGSEIADWDFGLVDRNREPKPSLYAVSAMMENVPFKRAKNLPFISVVVCTYNGSATIRECLEGILKLDYPDFEVVVINDGSTDNIEEIIKEYPVKLISTANHGLSNARNTGMSNATGEIIAYIDDDAYPDPQWLLYLASAYMSSTHSCIGGPNIVPVDSPFMSTCVANAPGGPVHVLESDVIAEHVPGCNMTFRREALIKLGGFDPKFRAAGDDVDLCWRIQESGGTIGFHPGAVVWHHRRNSFKAYWKQQKGYGKAEALLESKWPAKYNSLGHVTWAGRIYGNGSTIPVKVKKDRIFHGSWGSALFQSIYQPAGGFISMMPLMPEWYLLTAIMGILGALGFLWSPLLWFWPLLGLTLAVVFVQAGVSARKNSSLQPDQRKKFKYIITIIFLHLIQPVARLYGRFSQGLTPWRKRGPGLNRKFKFILGSRIFSHWSEHWRATEDWLTLIETNLTSLNSRVRRGGDFDRWDLQSGAGLFARARGLLAIEEHGGGKQFLKFRCAPRYQMTGVGLALCLGIPAALAFITGSFIAGGILTFLTGLVCFQIWFESARAMSSFYFALKQLENVIPEVEVVELRKPNGEIPFGIPVNPLPAIRKRSRLRKKSVDSLSTVHNLSGDYLLEDK